MVVYLAENKEPLVMVFMDDAVPCKTARIWTQKERQKFIDLRVSHKIDDKSLRQALLDMEKSGPERTA